MHHAPDEHCGAIEGEGFRELGGVVAPHEPKVTVRRSREQSNEAGLMTTFLTKPVTRRVEDRRHGVLNVTLSAEGVVIRELGRRRPLPTVSYGLILLSAAKISADLMRKERMQRRRRKS